MKLQDLIVSLNEDLSREYSHWHFYIQASALVQGLHRKELAEFLRKEAEGEMEHVQEFAQLLVSLGARPTTTVAPFVDDLYSPVKILEEAIRMETEVVAFYSQRMDDCDTITEPDEVITAKYIHAFVEQQLLDSRKDADEMKQMLKGL